MPSVTQRDATLLRGQRFPRRRGWHPWRRSPGWLDQRSLPMPPGPPMAATPGAGVGVVWFDQAQADQLPVLIHSLDRVAVQLQLADHRRLGSQAQARAARHATPAAHQHDAAAQAPHDAESQRASPNRIIERVYRRPARASTGPTRRSGPHCSSTRDPAGSFRGDCSDQRRCNPPAGA